MKTPLLFTLLLFLAIPLGAQYSLGEHPRLFVTRDMLPELAERARGGGMLGGDYAMIKAEADRVVAEKTFRMINSVWHRPTDMLCASLAYLVERELGNPQAGLYAEAVKEIWGDGSQLSRSDLNSSGSGHFGSYAIAYDWIYDSMTAAERKKFGDQLGGWLLWYTDAAEITLRFGGWLFNQTWGPSHLNTPNCRDGITPKLFVALALAGAGTAYESDCRRFLDSWYNRIPLDCLSLFNRMGGVWAESMGHGGYGPVKVIPWAFEGWRTATGQDWFQLGSPTMYLKEMNRWIVHLRVPFNNITAYIDDNSGGWDMEQVAPILAARYSDPVACKLSEEYDRGSWPEKWFSTPWIRFITHDPGVRARTPGEMGWARARLFTGAGHVYMRSAWDDPDATWAFFGAGPAYALHSRDDEGHFLIAKKGWLVLRAGGQGHNDDDYYIGGSLAYNIVTVFDPLELFDRQTPSPERLAQGGTKNERDGGMIRRVYAGGHQDIKERGQITAYKHTPQYTYSAADLTQAYNSSKISEITRQFLYLRGEREFFVIFDRVEATRSDYPKHWFLHIPGEPRIAGTPTELVAGHVYSSEAPEYVTWLSDPAGTGDYVLSSGRARAFLKTVLPRSTVTTKRGGEGHDFWGHPDEPTAQYNHVGRSSNQTPVVPWRLEVRAPTGSQRDYFLHVLEIGDESDTAMSAVATLEEDTLLAGVRITTASGGQVEVQFGRHGAPSGRVRFGGAGSFEPLQTEIDTTGQLGLRGDLDRDGRLSILDAVSMLVRGVRDRAAPELDFNGDGLYSPADVTGLLDYIMERRSFTALAGAPEAVSLGLSPGQTGRAP